MIKSELSIFRELSTGLFMSVPRETIRQMRTIMKLVPTRLLSYFILMLSNLNKPQINFLSIVPKYLWAFQDTQSDYLKLHLLFRVILLKIKSQHIAMFERSFILFSFRTFYVVFPNIKQQLCLGSILNYLPS